MQSEIDHHIIPATDLPQEIMARKIRRKTKRRISETKIQRGIVRKFSLTESYTGLILGAIVVLIAGILFITFGRGNRIIQTSSTSDIQEQELQDSKTSSTYTVNPGDSLWSISEKIYNNGYKWIEIAELNKLENPGLIYTGNKLALPKNAGQKQIAVNIQANSEILNAVKNNSITGNTYTVAKGDNLWNIAVRAYGDGFKWLEIAKANNLINPDIIHPGNVFRIPR